jgi:hypothetical protein
MSSSLRLKAEADPVSETLFNSHLKYWKLDNANKPSDTKDLFLKI